MNNPLGMSDADFLNAPLDSFDSESTEENNEASVADNEEQDEYTEDTTNTGLDDTEDTSEEFDQEHIEEEAAEETQDETEESDEELQEEVEETESDIPEEFKKLFEPFKANGRDISVTSVDEAIQLMKMGANYTKKMTALKPNLKALRMLEDNDLLDVEQLSFLIDLKKKDPNAVSKFLKDSGIDPLDIDLDASTDYKGGNNVISDEQLDVESVLDTIRDTSTYNRTIQVITEEWDDRSREFLSKDPNIIADINSHMESGIFDIVQNEMEKQRILGRLQGLSDLQAYKVVGDALNEQGKFDKAPVQSTSQNQGLKSKQTAQKQSDPALKAKKQAAGITKGRAPTKRVEDDFNPLSLSDEEFEKRFGNMRF